MVSYSSYHGKLIKMVEPYPIYNVEDEVIGYTEIGDMAVVTLADEDQDYYETVIVSGKYTGIDSLALNKNDLQKSIFVFNKIEHHGSEVYIKNKKVKHEYR